MSNNIYQLASTCAERIISYARTHDWSEICTAIEMRFHFSEQNLPMDLCDEFIADRISARALRMLNRPFPERKLKKMRREMVGA